MSSKVIVNIPTDPFQQQINKAHQEIAKSECSTFLGLRSTDPVIRAHQLEQNIRFLQEQHQIMLAGLHSEIDSLRQKNRDLQFQIVFSKGVALVQNSPSPSDESPRNITLSPTQVNITPLQVEILERNISELRTNLSEARSRNIHLQNVIDEQKKKMTALENEKLDLASVGKKVGKENISKPKSSYENIDMDELHEKLEDADRLIRRLKRENEEQRKEIVCLRTSFSKNKMEHRRNDGNSTHRHYYRNGQSQNSRFPPLQNHPHWKNSVEHQSNQNTERGGSRSNKDSETGRNAPSLPYLRDRNNASTSTGYSNPAYNNYQGQNHKRGYYYHKKQEDHRNNGRSKRDQQQQQQPDTER